MALGSGTQKASSILLLAWQGAKWAANHKSTAQTRHVCYSSSFLEPVRLLLQVAYLSPEQTPQQSLLKDQHLLRVTPKKGAASSSVTPASTIRQPAANGAVPSQAAPFSARPAQGSEALLASPGAPSVEGVNIQTSSEGNRFSSGSFPAIQAAGLQTSQQAISEVPSTTGTPPEPGESKSVATASAGTKPGPIDDAMGQLSLGESSQKGLRTAASEREREGAKVKGEDRVQGKAEDRTQNEKGNRGQVKAEERAQGKAQDKPKVKAEEKTQHTSAGMKEGSCQASEQEGKQAEGNTKEQQQRAKKKKEGRQNGKKGKQQGEGILQAGTGAGNDSAQPSSTRTRDAGSDQKAALEVLAIPTFGASDVNSSGTTAGSMVEHLDALHEALQCTYRGDLLFLQNNLLDALRELNKSQEIFCRLPVELPGKISPEFKLLILSGMMQSLGIRVRILGCMGERAAMKHATPLAMDAFYRMFRDCQVMMRADPEGSYGYTMGALALCLLQEIKACMALLLQARGKCQDKDLPKHLQVWLAQAGHSIVPGPVGDTMLAAFQLKQQEWAAAAVDDFTFLARMQKKSYWRVLFGGRIRDETSRLFSTHSDKDHSPMYDEKPYKGHLAMWEDTDLVWAVGRTGLLSFSVLRALAQEHLPHGVFNEMSCGWQRCKGGGGDWSQCNTGEESKAAKHAIPPCDLELAKRCNEFGIQEARRGRIVEAGLWFSRGVVLLMPHGWDYGHRLPEACRVVALALIFNRSMMYLELETRIPFQKNLQVGDWHRALADGLWCAYFGQGWTRAEISLASMLQYPPDCFSVEGAIVEATRGFTEKAPCLCGDHVKRGAIPRLPILELLSLMWSISEKSRVVLDNISWMLEHTVCSVRYTKLRVMGYGERKLKLEEPITL